MSPYAVWVTLRHRDAILLRARGDSYREIANELGYRAPSGVVDAIRSGVDRSGLRPGLAVVMHRRVAPLYEKILARVGDDTGFDIVLFEIHLLDLALADGAERAGSTPGVRDVGALIARRGAHGPAVAKDGPGSPFNIRMGGATLDQMRTTYPGVYKDGSGVHRALERGLRRELLAASAELFETDLAHLDFAWYELGLDLRRARLDASDIRSSVQRLKLALENLKVPGVVSDVDLARVIHGVRSP